MAFSMIHGGGDLQLRFGHLLVIDDGAYLLLDILVRKIRVNWYFRWQARLVFTNVLVLIFWRRFRSDIRIQANRMEHCVRLQDKTLIFDETT